MTERIAIDCALREAYLDGELSAVESAAFDRHVAACAVCKRELERDLRLRSDLRGGLRRYKADDALRNRILAHLPAEPPKLRRREWSNRREWLSMAVAACFGAVLAGSASFYTLRQPNEDLWAEAILKTHLRATLSGHVLDVASSDRHTVKPWFSGKTSVAPVVVDLASAGYPLLGGRLDIPETEPLPVLVYRAGPHLVSVTVRPASGDRGVTVANRDGFSIAEWREHGFAFSVVSDADANELGAFQAAFSHALRTLP